MDIYEDFEDMNLKESLLRGIYSCGFEKPSSIQQQAIIPITTQKDIIAQAQSGTGKTATFTVGMLQRLDEKDTSSQVIIIAHTRELAYQIKDVINNLSTYMNISINISVGGIDVLKNIRELNNKPQIVIGTPGRLLDMIERGYLKLNKLKMLILDEADELLSDIFVHQIQNIFRYLDKGVQVCVFSATMNETFFNITHNFMTDPIKILVKNEELTLDGIKQYYVDVSKNDYKFDTLCDLYSTFSMSQSIIYCNSKRVVEILFDKLYKLNYSVSYIHGGMNQAERDKRIQEFRNSTTRVLISTDLLARGIDIQQISIVINYDIPKEKENYIHRIGRSGRYGRKGVALNLITTYDMDDLKVIERYYNTEIVPLPNVDVLQV